MGDPSVERLSLPLPGGDTLLLRRADETDRAFLEGLFKITSLRAMGLNDSAGLERLLEMQLQSRERAYAATWPLARRWLVEHDDVPVGSLIEADDGDAVYIVDIAFIPQLQGHGFGSAVLAEVQRRAATAGRGVSAHVMVSNVASLALFRRRGFVGAARHGDAQIGVRWQP